MFSKYSHLTPEKSSVTYLAFIVAELVPFVSYFWLNEPHDCFRCLGKDPDRRFSIFQLTRWENLMREHKVKHGKGAFGVIGNLSFNTDADLMIELGEPASPGHLGHS